MQCLRLASRCTTQSCRLARRPGYVHMCAARHRKGSSVCPHDLVFPIAEADEMILDVIAGEVLEPNFIEELVPAGRGHDVG